MSQQKFSSIESDNRDYTSKKRMRGFCYFVICTDFRKLGNNLGREKRLVSYKSNPQWKIKAIERCFHFHPTYAPYFLTFLKMFLNKIF